MFENKMKIALLGFGTVGVGVYDMISRVPGMECRKILVRPGKEEPPQKVSDMKEILRDGDISCVVEVMGGVDPAYDYAVKAITSGKHFVTSNKALVAEKGMELATLAEKEGVAFLFSAACGGAIPFLHNLAMAVKTDEITELGGILNGTTNYILECMQRKEMSFSDALKKAQELGYAEKDPSADLSGLDSLRKILLACMVGYGKLPLKGFHAEGVESFTAKDAAFLKANGLTCRLMATAKEENGNLSAYVEPALYPAGAEECAIKDNYNFTYYIGKNCGKMTFSGQGAGRYPTASAVLRDLSDIREGKEKMMMYPCMATVADNSKEVHSYLIRTDAGIDFAAPGTESVEADGFIYRILPGQTVAQMHDLAEKLRLVHQEIFFARIN